MGAGMKAVSIGLGAAMLPTCFEGRLTPAALAFLAGKGFCDARGSIVTTT